MWGRRPNPTPPSGIPIWAVKVRTQSFFTHCSWSPCLPVSTLTTGTGLGPLSSCVGSPFLSHLHFWNALSDSPSPPRLQLSVLKYQSLPHWSKRRYSGSPSEAGEHGHLISFRVRIALSGSQIKGSGGFPVHSFQNHCFRGREVLAPRTPVKTLKLLS